MSVNNPYSTPMMVQYMEIKKKYSDCIVFFRLGDFYEMFLEDAKTGSKVLGITLTTRSRGEDGNIPMAGVPYHAVDTYLAKFVKAGYKIAIVEQLSEPDKKQLVERDVVRIVTPGTILDDKALEGKSNNYIVSIEIGERKTGFSAADLSTGAFHVTQIENDKHYRGILNELVRFDPKECILTPKNYENKQLLKTIKEFASVNISKFVPVSEEVKTAEKTLKKHFNILSTEALGINNKSEALMATALLLEYLQYTQKHKVQHMQSLKTYDTGDTVTLDMPTITNLELIKTLRTGERRGSLINTIDKTITPMGGRKLKEWVLKPSKNIKELKMRQEVVALYKNNRKKRTHLREMLSAIQDIERLLAKISVGTGNPRDLLGLAYSLEKSSELRELLVDTEYEKILNEMISQDIQKISNEIKNTLNENPPVDPKQGDLIRSNISLELDKLKETINKSKNWINNLEEAERKKTGINTLKIKFNKVFGYYIEISKANLHLAPKDYERKQTLVNAERFITPELKTHEEIILNAEETTNKLEYEIFLNLVDIVAQNTESIQKTANSVAILDCLLSFSEHAELNDYVKPELNSAGTIDIHDGRHPVVEELLDNIQFVPNNSLLATDNQLMIITGPNMAGKSVYIRQVALIVLLAQIGSFVPAKKAIIGLVDKIFVRSGASDIITSGLSTFMVEMVETANILNNATNNSLIIMDEIGRGTSTYDGISIAWSVAEYLVSNKNKIYPKTLFATHYHELIELEDKFPDKVKNFQVAVSESNGDPIFLHKVIPGGAGHSYGISVAKLAGVPEEVTSRAREILNKLEKRANE